MLDTYPGILFPKFMQHDKSTIIHSFHKHNILPTTTLATSVIGMIPGRMRWGSPGGTPRSPPWRRAPPAAHRRTQTRPSPALAGCLGHAAAAGAR